jgi:SAM-dependent methyltransferase
VDDLRLRLADGSVSSLEIERWHDDASEGEVALLRTLRGPVLDVGCGPGRLVVALGRLGRVALGLDPAPGAVSAARGRGAAVLQRSVFDPLPGEGRWQTVLLMDGNVGIGGDPVRLLKRCAALVHPSGDAVVEVSPAGAGDRRLRARLERGSTVGPWFSWAEVGLDALPRLAGAAGWVPEAIEEIGLRPASRWIARLHRSRDAGVARAVA